MPYQRGFGSFSPISSHKNDTLDPYINTFERPEVEELFAFLTGKVRTLCLSGNNFYANFSLNKNHNFLLSVQHLFLDNLDFALQTGLSLHPIWECFVKGWLISNKEIDGNPRLILHFLFWNLIFSINFIFILIESSLDFFTSTRAQTSIMMKTSIFNSVQKWIHWWP